MKFIKILVLCLGLVATQSSCDMTDFGDINKSPNDPSDAHTSMLFTFACTYVKYFTLNTNYYYPWTQMYTGYMAEKNTCQYGALGQATFSTSSYYLYPLKNCKFIIDLNTDEATKGTPAVMKFGSNNNQIAVAKTLMAFIYMHLTDALGPIPYTEAFQSAEDNFKPAFDSQETIYTRLDEDLREAYSMFDTSSSLSSDDILYNGKIASWKKLNASIRMMLAIKLAEVAPADGKSRFAQAYADGGIDSNEFNLNYKFDENTVGYLYYNGVNNNGNFVPNKFIVDQLKAYKDNRLFSMCSLLPFGASQSDAGVSDEDLVNFDKYQGTPLGVPNSELSELRGKCCYYNPSLTQVTSTFPVITASRILLIEAEAAQRGWISADASALYEAGIKASFDQWGAEYTDDYLAQADVAYTGSDAEKLAKIAMQRWIGGFMADAFEAWSDWRRFEVPTLTVGPECTTINHIPYRHQYDGEIFDANRANYEAAVKAELNGEDSREQRVWWNKK